MSKHELLAAHLRGFEDHRCNLAADALEAQAREIEGLRKQDEALLAEALAELQWWVCEHGCCAGHEGDLLDRIDASLKS